MAFDGDRAGISATERAINLAQEIGVELEVVSLPDDVKDPDELIQKDPALWQVAVEQAQPAVDWVIARHAEMEDLATAIFNNCTKNRARPKRSGGARALFGGDF